MKRSGISLLIAMLIAISSVTFGGDSRKKKEDEQIVKTIQFGKYDEYAFVIYENTRRLPKKDKLVTAVSIEVKPKVQCDYRFEFTIPKKIARIKVWDFGDWKELREGHQHSTAIPTHGVTYRLKGNKYTIIGSYAAGLKGGFIRGMFRGEYLPIGDYKLDILVNNTRYQTIHFKMVHQFQR